jgi:3-mercaptopyruvate sulfurtransferase SseA
MQRSFMFFLILFSAISALSLISNVPAVQATELTSCAKCHIDEDILDELTEEIIAEAEDPDISDLQAGRGCGVKQAPFDAFEKNIIDEDFLATIHGQIACNECHKGNPKGETPEEAHKGMVKDPSLDNLEAACAKCHYKITKNAGKSLHTSPETMLKLLKERSSPDQWEDMHDKATSQHCFSCHISSCGSCHVSRPDVTGGGLMNGHLFKKKPDFVYQCASCHTIPMANDYTGLLSLGDVHYRNGRMVCTDCHKANEMHASGVNVKDRYHLPEMPNCTDCHQDLEQGAIRTHGIHSETVACHVCHSQAYQNCKSCHLGTDEDDIAYSKSDNGAKYLKIGLNYDKSIPGKNPDYILVRQVPVQEDTFTGYTKEKLKHFSSQPTFKRTSPHNIQRKTWQNAHCNHCHGNKKIFLQKDDIPAKDLEANRNVIVPDAKIPKRINAMKPLRFDNLSIDNDVKVDAKWLNEHKDDSDLIIIDVRDRSLYEKGHIPGAYSLCSCHVRTNNMTNPPFMMFPPEELAKEFSERVGLTKDKRVIIYDDGKTMTSIVFMALEIIGHKKVSFLDGNLTKWKEMGFKVETGQGPDFVASNYVAEPQKILVDNKFIKQKMERGEIVLIDARNVSQHVGHTKRDIAHHPGRIPGATSLSVRALWGKDSTLRSVDEISWILKNHHIHPSMQEVIVTTCNTNPLAGELYMILRYLGYKNVLVHDGAWLEWAGKKR